MAARIVILEDDESLRLVIAKALSRAGFDVRATASPDAAIDRLARREADALVADVLLGRENFLDRLDEVARVRPDAPIIIMSAQTTAQTALAATRAGVFEYLPKPFDLNDLVDLLKKALQDKSIADVSPAQSSRPELVGRSPAMQKAFRALGRLAQSSVPVMVVGPSGSGRAAALRMLYAESGRSGPLIEAGPDRLRRSGPSLLDEAAGGALLMRRVEGWDSSVRDWVLEALETKTGPSSPRLLATASDLVAEQAPKPLLDRLATGYVVLPPVRERGADRALLFEAFLRREGGGSVELSAEARTFINTQVWDGEVLEIERTASRLVAQGGRGRLEPADIAAALSAPGEVDPVARLEDAAARFFASQAGEGDAGLADAALAAFERGLFRAALDASGGVRGEAARRLGMNRNTLARRLDALGLGADET